ncbi:hypothetical protein BGW38_000478 [Lunasporangiospora selenospora]|uniref:polynucleotide adenylyltransferase n=1 Tax=Lunasporangiospora selenospora TaxID=979761 RepID=A0A9P6G2F3_9FUNG|nr:hypothetical protein BGW38_000478 [Lunasporangiospora selenospora]
MSLPAETVSNILYAIFFEYGAKLGSGYHINIPYSTLAQCFNQIIQYYIDYDLNDPVDQYISRHFLNISHMIKMYIMRRPGTYENYLDFIYSVNQSGVSVRGLTDIEVQDFLWEYVDTVDEGVQDDIAFIIAQLREDIPDFRDSGGALYMMDNGLYGVQKYTNDHCRLKREKRDRRRESEAILTQTAQLLEIVSQTMKLHIDGEKRLSDFIKQLGEQHSRSLARSTKLDDVYALEKMISNRLRDYYNDDTLTVQIYGSYVTGLATDSSDVDFVVRDSYSSIPNVSRLARVLRSIPGINILAVIDKARIPIVNFKYGSIHCDMCINEFMGLHNSKLIATYCKIDSRVIPLWLALKTLAKRRGILSGSTGFLSSYALLLMLITFLQTKLVPPILPRLQLQPAHRLVSLYEGSVDCSFDRNWSNYVAIARENTRTMGSIFMEFCNFFGNTFDYKRQEVHPQKGEIRTRPHLSSNPTTAALPRNYQDRRRALDAAAKLRNSSICIIDPFLLSRNVASNCRDSNVEKIRECFQDAYLSLMDGDLSIIS